VHLNLITLWKKQLLENASLVFDKNGKDKELKKIADHEEELYGQIGRLKAENEFLKKSTNRYTAQSIISGAKT
jgi:transposase